MILVANQSNYIPWKGYFDLINDADQFVFYDEVQYTVRDWRNRNLIKTPNGAKWLSVPVVTKGKFDQTISETIISEKDWAKNHWNTIYENYHKNRHFDYYAHYFEKAYSDCGQMDYLCNVNYYFIRLICSLLDIKTPILNSKDLNLADGKAERVLKMCVDCGASLYLGEGAILCLGLA